MYQLHFKKCHSTQTYLKENIENLAQHGENLLVSAEQQTKGVGRTGNSWISLSNALAFSFTLAPAETLTLTPLEIGILTCEFIFKIYKVKLFLKWPNDLLNSQNEKCGGIMMNYHNPKKVIVGIGLNLGTFDHHETHNDFHTKPSSIIDEKLEEADYQKIPEAFVNYIYQNRIKNDYIRTSFLSLCAHKNVSVQIIESRTKLIEGKFINLGLNGEAIIEDETGKISEFLSGSLRIL